VGFARPEARDRDQQQRGTMGFLSGSLDLLERCAGITVESIVSSLWVR